MKFLLCLLTGRDRRLTMISLIQCPMVTAMAESKAWSFPSYKKARPAKKGPILAMMEKHPASSYQRPNAMGLSARSHFRVSTSSASFDSPRQERVYCYCWPSVDEPAIEWFSFHLMNLCAAYSQLLAPMTRRLLVRESRAQ